MFISLFLIHIKIEFNMNRKKYLIDDFLIPIEILINLSFGSLNVFQTRN